MSLRVTNFVVGLLKALFNWYPSGFVIAWGFLMNTQLTGCILSPQGWVRGAIKFNERVLTIEGQTVDAPTPDENLLLPGFIDLHVHGGGGRDIMEGNGAVDTVARLHVQHGTTSFLATTMTDSREAIEHALTDIGRAVKNRAPGSARALGVHLEGPFISAGRLGAQPPASRPGSLDEVLALQALAPIRVLTLAPEITGHLTFIKELKALGVRVQMGHSNATYEEGLAAFEAGAQGFTHLFNAMSELHHRKPGLVGLALAHADYAEIIPDLLHVHPGAIRLARRAIPKLYCVTDSTSGAGMPDGNYRLGTQAVIKCLGGVRLADGTLAGSILTLDQAFRNLVSIGFSLQEASALVSTHPADYLGETERGRLQPGAFADIVEMSPNLQLSRIFVEGEAIER